MPSPGGYHSPSLQKMEVGNGRYSGGKGFSMGNIAGDPFWLGSIGIGTSGWLIAFVSSIIADISDTYPNYSWWCLVYMLFLIIGVFYVVGSDSVFTYHVAMAALLSAGLVFTTSSVNSLIYAASPAKEAAAAGFILLSICTIVWMLYFGSQPQASHRQTLDSLALHKDRVPTSRSSRAMRQSYRPDTTLSAAQQHQQHQQQMYNSNHLAGFETASPVTGYPGGAPGVSSRASAAQFPQPLNQQSSHPTLQGTNGASGMGGTETSGGTAPETYPYRAKAIYSYEANPDDANEISFSKHEILEVSDVSGRWWQAKKENGETGIAPSNYLILL
ncbi:unnamed protein product [Zymoseptoria tritici ST99CH_1A5]|uniref:SH3 domain-containing protein n=3 Tax=Zymoseptoria tritici TaxID=1047171 RepID=F9X695_ZYMTI|nr:uncharacterized protein MYCGRDRAFT_108657 [Zymoseptoria tritici IPO323]EGP88856.1 hypothetical protein MYCGRDRAFT_108657 [Zymoseptoria tritici IPO323]SMR48743.1 unnamed protein product [Zymoseptoria tritici ST99CH_1E4]SMR49927.1 unnamed protein product [Zymoseptoria tritici ST99CH_3D1]SMY22628.1 unnamed protein product [Zymoseptoria tritici ST99CH_1A5]